VKPELKEEDSWRNTKCHALQTPSSCANHSESEPVLLTDSLEIFCMNSSWGVPKISMIRFSWWISTVSDKGSQLENEMGLH